MIKLTKVGEVTIGENYFEVDGFHFEVTEGRPSACSASEAALWWALERLQTMIIKHQHPRAFQNTSMQAEEPLPVAK